MISLRKTNLSSFYNFNKSDKDKTNKTHLIMSPLSLKPYSWRTKSELLCVTPVPFGSAPYPSSGLSRQSSAHILLSGPTEFLSSSRAGLCFRPLPPTGNSGLETPSSFLHTNSYSSFETWFVCPLTGDLPSLIPQFVLIALTPLCQIPGRWV